MCIHHDLFDAEVAISIRESSLGTVKIVMKFIIDLL